MEVSEVSQTMPFIGMGPMKPPDAAELSDMIIDEKDANGDGVLSIDELGISEDKFSAADTNGDGFISQQELIAKITEKMESMGAPPTMESEQMPDINEIKCKMAQMMLSVSEDEESQEETGAEMINRLLASMGLSEEESDSFFDMLANNRFSTIA